MTQSISALEQAQNIQLPPRESMLNRLSSVKQFWEDNRKLLTEAWVEWESITEGLLIPDETLLDSRLRDAIDQAWEDPSKESEVADLWEEVIPGVYVAQFFEPERLAEFRNYLEQTVASKIPTRPPYGIALNRHGVMLDERSEGYLAAPNFQTFYHAIMNRYMRPIARLLLDTYGYDNQTFGFSIQYNPEEDRDLQPHTDASSATLNININLPSENFTGSEVDFFDKESGRTVRTIFESGKALIHRGSVPHATHPITSGQRNNLVVWLYGDRMQVPRGSTTNSYGNFAEVQTIDTPDNLTAEQRWTVPTAPKDAFAPF